MKTLLEIDLKEGWDIVSPIEIISKDKTKRNVTPVLRIINSLPSLIRCKALRKQGTDEWYFLKDDARHFEARRFPDCWPDDFTNKTILRNAPPDAELVSLVIYVEPNKEGGK